MNDRQDYSSAPDTPPERSERGRNGDDAQRARRPVVSAILGAARLVLIAGVLGAGVYAAYWFNATEGRAQKSAGEPEGASRLVETVGAHRGDLPVRVRAMGTVMAAREAVIRPRVSGMIVEQAEAFVPGGFFEEGAFMLRIDRADYEQALLQRESELAQAQATLQIELGDQAVAREELELLEVDIPEINRDLILRIPQVNQAKAQVRSAEAGVQRAELDLRRTRIGAPFDGHIVDRSVSVGNNVSAGDALATFVGAERYWIELAVPVSSLRWIETPASPGEAGSPARVRYPRAWGERALREARVTQLVGRLEEGSRLARVIVEVPDPLARDAAREGAPELILGAFVDVEIVGRTLEDAFAIDRTLVREDDTVWVMGEDERLVTKHVTIAYRGREHAYVTGGLADGDRIVTTNLQTPVDGMLLREAPTDDGDAPQAEEGGDDG